MSITYAAPGQRKGTGTQVGILGLPGVGKTRLAATFYKPLFIDLEPDGARTALDDGVHRAVVSMSPTTVADTIKLIQALKKAPENDRVVEFKLGENIIEVGTLVIDTLNVIQRSLQTFKILRGRSVMERRDWGVLLEEMQKLVLEWAGLPVDVVIVCHAKSREDEGKKINVVDFAVRGGLRDELPGWFSNIIHITAGKDGRRFVVSQPGVYNNTRFVAKDRHGVLVSLRDEKTKLIEITSEDGYPNRDIALAICGR